MMTSKIHNFFLCHFVRHPSRCSLFASEMTARWQSVGRGEQRSGGRGRIDVMLVGYEEHYTYNRFIYELMADMLVKYVSKLFAYSQRSAVHWMLLYGVDDGDGIGDIFTTITLSIIESIYGYLVRKNHMASTIPLPSWNVERQKIFHWMHAKIHIDRSLVSMHVQRRPEEWQNDLTPAIRLSCREKWFSMIENMQIFFLRCVSCARQEKNIIFNDIAYKNEHGRWVERRG